VQADYTPGAGAAKGEDFSVVYSYDAMARPTRVRRSGIIDMDADGNEKFGDLDILQYSYDQAGRVAAIDNDPEGVDYYGRPGFPSAGSEYDWDAAGRMTADTGRGISLIKYDHRNLPSKTTFDNGRTVTYSYDADGALIRSATRTLAVRPTLNPGKATVRTYAADRVWENNKLLYSYFPGGYFDADGHVHYLHNDYQGSVVLVTDSAGTVEQRNTYYPYGEPHRTPAGQPRLYAGKERMAVTGEYDYGARQHFAPGLLWSVPDAMAEKFYPISPYVFCNGNPIANVDPDGNSPTIIPALIGGGIGATLYSGVELVKQLFQDGPMDWSAVGGAAARGAVVGTVTGGTLGIGTSAAIAATTAANVAGGMADRAIQGEEVLSTEDIITDAAVGAASGAVGAVMGKAAEKVIDKASPAWKGKVGEKMTQIKYELKGNKVEGRNFEVDAGYKTPIRGKQATAKYDFNFKNRFTGKQIIRESKFNTADYTKNQRLAIKNCPYDFDKDVNTSKDLGQWVRASYSAYPALTPSK
ncbi:MAG: hypothetical protein HDS30_02285, partial [Bacteroides sp.]|nr:hypothetical protein [Bacteroides sp.]